MNYFNLKYPARVLEIKIILKLSSSFIKKTAVFNKN